MGKIIKTTITDFSRGSTTDLRTTERGFVALTKNFDTSSFRHKLVPLRSSESGDSAPTTSQKQAFLWYNNRIYALGVVSGTGRAEVLYKDDLTTNGWNTPSNNQSSVGATSFNLFIEYKDYLYGARAGTNIWRFDPAGGAWADTHQALSYSNIAQGLVHSKDDILYIPYDNKIAKNNAGSWTTAALTLPDNLVITSICEYGNLLAIGCRSADSNGRSRVFLWDRDSTLSTLSESIDWGVGDLKILENVDGTLIGISILADNFFTSRIQVRQYLGGDTSVVIRELVSSGAGAVLPQTKQKVGSRLYFLMSFELGSTMHDGLWQLSRPSPDSPFALSFDRTPNNDTAITNGVLKGFFILGDYVLISYVDNGDYALSKTIESATYTATSIYESPIFATEGSHTKKQLCGASVTFEKLPANGQVVLKYRTDGDTSWTTVFTHTTDDTVSRDAVNTSAGTSFGHYRELEFRIESTGGAIPTGLFFKEEIIDEQPY